MRSSSFTLETSAFGNLREDCCKYRVILQNINCYCLNVFVISSSKKFTGCSRGKHTSSGGQSFSLMNLKQLSCAECLKCTSTELFIELAFLKPYSTAILICGRTDVKNSQCKVQAHLCISASIDPAVFTGSSHYSLSWKALTVYWKEALHFTFTCGSVIVKTVSRA